MNYEDLSHLMEANAEKLAYQVVKKMIDKEAAYYDVRIKVMAQSIQSAILVIATYIRDGDINQLRNHIIELGKNRLGEGDPVESIKAVGIVIFSEVNNLVEQELPGAKNEETRKKYQQRLERIRTVADTVLISTRIMQGPKPPTNYAS